MRAASAFHSIWQGEDEERERQLSFHFDRDARLQEASHALICVACRRHRVKSAKSSLPARAERRGDLRLECTVYNLRENPRSFE
jgi:hypothetical protein